jgi:hypothetical protein
MKVLGEFKVLDRWEEGIDNHEESIRLARLIGDVDFEHYSDSFCLKFGGDGDNGETLAYILDDLIDAGLIEIKIKEQSK